jgi:hypothetical protein
MAGICGRGLFEPQSHGIQPIEISSACHRGFHCVYEVAEGWLKLRRVYLGLRKEDAEAVERERGPRLFGKTAHRYPVVYGGSTGESKTLSSDFVVAELDEVIAFDGGLLLGGDLIQETYVQAGFHPAYRYRVVYELIFQEGRLMEEADRSGATGEFREMLADGSSESGANATREEVDRWIARCFWLDYR